MSKYVFIFIATFNIYIHNYFIRKVNQQNVHESLCNYYNALHTDITKLSGDTLNTVIDQVK